MEKIIFIFLSLSFFLTDKETQAQDEQITLVSEVQDCLILTKKERKKLFTATNRTLKCRSQHNCKLQHYRQIHCRR